MKTPLIILLLSSLPIISAAQDNLFAKEGDDLKKFTGAVVMGLNFSQVDGDSYYGYHKVGLNAGAQVFIHFTNTVGITLELLYTRKGSRAVIETESLTQGAYFYKYYMDVNYVEVPILFHVTQGKYDYELGASYARLVNSKEFVVTDQPVYIDPIGNRFNTSDIDFTIGLTRHLYKNMMANIRYQYSLTSIRPPERIPYGYSYGNQGQFNNLFNLRLVYVF